MLPYLIAGAIGFVVAKLFEEDEAPKYADGGSVLLAPNGKPSNLTPEQYKLVRTPEFKAWFGDWENSPETASKVVDENGEPLVVYHGSRGVDEKTKFNSFNLGNGAYGEGIYFTADKKEASGWALGNYIYEVFLDVKNPFRETYYRKWNQNVTESKNYSGIIVMDLQDVSTIIAFEPEQIKLADGTNTTFDGSNPDIRFYKGGLIAPNGKPSNLTPLQYKLVRTPAFKAWFGDWENDSANASKVVDENGEPKVVARMDYERKYKYADEYPIFFCEKEDVKYFTEFGENEIYVFLNIKNPIIIQFGQSWDNIPYDELMKVFSEQDLTDMINYEWNENYKSWSEYLNSMDDSEQFLFSTDIISAHVKNKGLNDGVIIYDIDETSNHDVNTNDYIAFNSKQIKLADDTNTTFDGGNPDIRFDGGGSPKKVKFDIEQDEDGDRTEISIKGIGQVILVVTYPEYEFLEDIGEDGLEELGIEEGDMIGKIEYIRIEDKYKGQGYAKLLMNKVIEVAKEKGLMPLYLNASPMGSDGLDVNDLTGFYETFGFKVFLEQENNNLMILK